MIFFLSPLYLILKTDTRNSSHKQDSGKSSDSSISSAHGYRRLADGSGGGGSLRIGNSHHQRKQHSIDNCYRMLQESSSSHNIPHVTLPTADIRHHQHYPHPTLSYSISNSSDLAGSGSPSHSSSTPQLKKKFGSTEHQQQQQHVPANRESCPSVSKHQSFDYTGSKCHENYFNFDYSINVHKIFPCLFQFRSQFTYISHAIW